MASPLTAHITAAGLTEPTEDNPFVLSGRPLRPGTDLAATPRYTDQVWQLTAALLQSQQGHERVDFRQVPDSYIPPIKQLVFAMLSGPLPPHESRPKIMSIKRHFTEFVRVTRWAVTRPGPPRLAEIALDDLAEYGQHVRATLRGEASREVALSAVRLLWRYRTVLPGDTLTVDPLFADGWGQSTRRARGENTTPRIPEDVMGPLLAWCTRIIEAFSPDILAAHHHTLTLLPAPPRTRHDAMTPAERTARLDRLLHEHRTSGTPLPGFRGRPNMQLVNLAAGIRQFSRTTAAQRTAVAETAALVGLTDGHDLDVPVTGRVDGRPWIRAITGGSQGSYGRERLVRLLHTACYVAIAYLSGMRDSEIKHLRRGCLRTHRDSRGQAYRWTITSLAFKGEHDPAGVPATWVVGRLAARAVHTLEQLHRPEVDLLLTLPGRADRAPRPPRVNDTNHLLRDLLAWIRRYCADHGRDDAVPDVDGTAWQLTTRQFRRTLAWYIARRPGGAIAGALQYRHLSIRMFEGYAGTSESGFRAEVEAEQALARGEHLLAMTTQHEHHLGGPAAADAASRLDSFASRAGFAGAVVTDLPRLRRLLKRHDPHVYPGTYVTCVFNVDKALCRPRTDGTGVTRPVPADCQPLECRNVAVTAANAEALRAEADRLASEAARRPTLPPLLLADLTARQRKITALLPTTPES
jgi:integrase